MKILYFGAVDIGSNAARLLISSVNTSEPQPKLRKAILLRIPLRLGEDVFSTGLISDQRTKKFVRMMKAYRHLLKLYEVESYEICATSAMREASNGANVVREIEKETGLTIEIIDGKTEAKIIYDSHIADYLDISKKYLYVDVGGGSTEISLLENGQMSQSKSFNIGTLRMLSGKVTDSNWADMEKWLNKNMPAEEVEIIGAGGNINKLYRLADLKKGEKLLAEKLQSVYDELKVLTVDERMIKYDMRPDRADVVIPAAAIFLFIAEKSGIKIINVPTIGLADGIVNKLYQNYKTTKI